MCYAILFSSVLYLDRETLKKPKRIAVVLGIVFLLLGAYGNSVVVFRFTLLMVED